MRVLLSLTYYRPHVSGLTIYVERLAAELLRRGHSVTVLAAQTSPELPAEEVVDGVRVVRAPVAVRAGKGVLVKGYRRRAARLVQDADVISAHLPQLEAPLLALVARRARRPLVATYHCDLHLPPGLVNRIGDAAAFAGNYLTVAAAEHVVGYTEDYTSHSPLLRRFRRKVRIILPPVIIGPVKDGDRAAFRATHAIGPRQPVLGMAARLAAEKGVETVVAALPSLAERFPDLVVLFAGAHEGVVGEEAYRQRILPALERLHGRWRFLGVLPPSEMPAFFGAIDCLLVPSLNSTESFGLVQVEAMLCGTPVVASDLPGVRQPVRMTGMGEIVPPGDAGALAESVGRVLSDRARWLRPRAEIASMFDWEASVEQYEALFEDVVGRTAAK